FFSHLQKDSKLFFLCAISLGFFRLIMVTRFWGQFADSVGMYDLIMALFIGTRFDAQISGIVVLPPLLCSIMCGFVRLDRFCDGLRKIMAMIFFFLSSFLLPVNYLFFLEYKDNFNQWIFGAIYDDFGAVLKTTYSEYPLLPLFIISFMIMAMILYFSLKFLQDPWMSHEFLKNKVTDTLVKVLMTCIILLLFVFAVRGSVGTRPVQRKDVAVTHDALLNKCILNPYSALTYTIKDTYKLFSAKGLQEYLPDGDVQKAAQLFFHRTESFPDLHGYMKKIAKGRSTTFPQHIFFIVMESLDSWPLMEKYKAFDLLPNFRCLGKEGILIRAFLPAGTGTMSSLAALITGIPDVGVFTNYQKSARKPFATSMATQFKKLGYEVNLFYGGYLSWQRIGDFCLAQGFDNTYGGGDMEAWSNNEWGVEDNELFEFVLKTLRNDKLTFNLLLSTSYHPPYDLPIYDLGFEYRQIPESLRTAYDGDIPIHVFGHLWYSDKVLAQFIRRAEQKFPFSLFAVTGDHWSRRFLHSQPTSYECSSVPLLLYGKEVLHDIMVPEKIAGSHIDVVPTLIELSAPEGFEYFSMGGNLLDFERLQIGLGKNKLITPDFIISSQGEVELLPFAKGSARVPRVDTLKVLLHAYYGVGWWSIMRGAGI
ncbi:MAG: LTA synthase family protein, partial [bacterium]